MTAQFPRIVNNFQNVISIQMTGLKAPGVQIASAMTMLSQHMSKMTVHDQSFVCLFAYFYF